MVSFSCKIIKPDAKIASEKTQMKTEDLQQKVQRRFTEKQTSWQRAAKRMRQPQERIRKGHERKKKKNEKHMTQQPERGNVEQYVQSKGKDWKYTAGACNRFGKKSESAQSGAQSNMGKRGTSEDIQRDMQESTKETVPQDRRPSPKALTKARGHRLKQALS